MVWLGETLNCNGIFRIRRIVMAYSRTPEIVMAPIKKTLFFIGDPGRRGEEGKGKTAARGGLGKPAAEGNRNPAAQGPIGCSEADSGMELLILYPRY